MRLTVISSVSALQNREDFVRDAFIRGFNNASIRTRLQENASLTLDAAFDQARALEQALKRADAYTTPGPVAASTTVQNGTKWSFPEEAVVSENDDPITSAAVNHTNRGQTCFNCGTKVILKMTRTFALPAMPNVASAVKEGTLSKSAAPNLNDL